MWTPDHLRDKLWVAWDAADLAGSDGDALTTWQDSTGSQLILTGTATLQTDELNGQNAVQFDGTADELTVDELGIAGQPCCMLAVWTMANASSQGLLGSTNTGSKVWINASGNYEVNGGTALSGAITKAAWRITTATFDSTTSAFTLDGTETTGAAGGNGFDDLFVGSLDAATYLTGKIAYLCLLRDLWTDEERQRLEGWAAWRFGLMGNLVSTHPWKATRP